MGRYSDAGSVNSALLALALASARAKCGERIKSKKSSLLFFYIPCKNIKLIQNAITLQRYIFTTGSKYKLKIIVKLCVHHFNDVDLITLRTKKDTQLNNTSSYMS